MSSRLKKFVPVTIGVALVILLSVVSPLLYAQAAIPREDTVYVIGCQWGPPTTWNMFSPTQTWGTNHFLYIPLFVYDGMHDVWLPMIAERYEWVSPEVLRVYIRPEARWSDGKPITAYDVEYTYETTKKLKYGPGVGCWDYVEYIKAVSDKVVEAKIRVPPKNYFSFLSCVLGFVPMPKHVIEPLYKKLGDKLKEWKNDDPAKQVVSGPYKLHHYTENEIVYVRLDDWWGKSIFGLPKPKYLAHVIYKDNPSANTAFEKGDADWAGTFIPSVWQLFPKGVGTWYSKKPYYVGWGVNFLYLNFNSTVFKKAEELGVGAALRKAIAYAIPYKDMLEKAYFGYGVQASASFVADIFPAYKKWVDYDLCAKYVGSSDCRFHTDLEMAKKILDEAGIVDRDGDGVRELPDGTPLKGLTISVPYGWTDWMMMCEMIASNLKKIGIDVRTYFPDYSVWWNNVINGKYDMVIGWDANPGFDHPWNTYRFVLDPRLSPPAGNWENYKNWKISKLIDEIASTIDPAKRMEFYREIQEFIYKDLPAIPLFYGAHWYAYNTKYWVGWPNEKNPWWFPAAPWSGSPGNSFIVLFGIAKKGEKPKVPDWLKPIDEGGLLIPTSKIWEDLAKVSKPTATPSPTTPTTPKTTPKVTVTAPGRTVTVTKTVERTVTKSVEVTKTVASTVTVEKTVPTTVVRTETNWGVVAAVAIVLLIVGIAIGYAIKRR
ncbi:MAG: ABC transporter substrate-binding protein [Thermoprotei archaeon]|nr:MAG: ABC transporter substrate-binding protein [Thermoprotei archaeon]